MNLRHSVGIAFGFISVQSAIVGAPLHDGLDLVLSLIALVACVIFMVIGGIENRMSRKERWYDIPRILIFLPVLIVLSAADFYYRELGIEREGEPMKSPLAYRIFSTDQYTKLDTVADTPEWRDSIIANHKKTYPKDKVYWYEVREG